MPQLIVVTGPPGAGKSTVAELLAEQSDPSALVAGDEFFGFLRRGAIAPWLEPSHRQNTAVVTAAAAAAGRMADYCDVVYDGVIGPWFLQTFLDAADVAEINYIVLLPPLDVCLARVAGRTGHGFRDRDAAEHMWHEFDTSVLDERYVLRGVTPAPELAVQIADGVRTGRIQWSRR